MRLSPSSHTRHAEPLEPRMLLAAPTATYVSASNNDTGVFVVVDYRSDVGLDTSSIGAGDLIAARAGGPTLTATLFGAPAVQEDGSTRAIYLFSAPRGAWDYTDTGHYMITSPNGQVVDTNGDDVGDGLIRDLSLWFTQPKAAVTSNTMRATDWLIVVNYTDDVAINTATIDAGDIRVEGAEVISGITLYQKFINSANNVTAVYRVPAPAGGWNYLHSGAYTVVLNNRTVLDTGGRGPGGHDLKTFPSIFFTAPSARVNGGTTVTGNEWLIPIKFSGLSAIDPATITSNLVTISAPTLGFSATATRTQLINNGDGTYIAVYKIPARGGFWDYSDNASYVVRVAPNIVKDINNRSAPGGDLRSFGLFFTTPAADIVSVAANQNDASKFDLAIRYHDNTTINPATITASAISVSGPSAVTITLLSVTAHPSGGYRAVFRITPNNGRLENGSYFVNSVANQVRDAANNPVGAGTMARYGLWFAP